MNAHAYLQGLEQRRALRRRLQARLQRIQDAYASLSAATGSPVPGPPDLAIGADPLAQIDRVCEEAATLIQRIRESGAQVSAAQQALAHAQGAAARWMTVLAGAAALVILFLAARCHGR